MKNIARHLEGDAALVDGLTQHMAQHGTVETSLTLSWYESWPTENDIFVFHADKTPPLFGWVRGVRTVKRNKEDKTEVIQITLGKRMRGISPLTLPGGKVA